MNWNRILYEHGAKYELEVNGLLKLIYCLSKKRAATEKCPHTQNWGLTKEMYHYQSNRGELTQNIVCLTQYCIISQAQKVTQWIPIIYHKQFKGAIIVLSKSFFVPLL